MTPEEEHKFPYKNAFEKCFDLFRVYYEVFGPLFPQKILELSPLDAIQIARTSIYKKGRLSPELHLALESRACIEILHMKDLRKSFLAMDANS